MTIMLSAVLSPPSLPVAAAFVPPASANAMASFDAMIGVGIRACDAGAPVTAPGIAPIVSAVADPPAPAARAAQAIVTTIERALAMLDPAQTADADDASSDDSRDAHTPDATDPLIGVIAVAVPFAPVAVAIPVIGIAREQSDESAIARRADRSAITAPERVPHIENLAAVLTAPAGPAIPSPITTSAAMQPPPADAVVDRQLDLAHGDAWLNDLARDIAATAGHGGRLRFALVPAMLGRLDVDVRRGDAGVTIQLAAHSEAVRDLLVAAQPRLLDDMRAQGIRVAASEIAADAAWFGGNDSSGAPRPPPRAAIDAAPPQPGRAPGQTKIPVADGRYA